MIHMLKLILALTFVISPAVLAVPVSTEFADVQPAGAEALPAVNAVADVDESGLLDTVASWLGGGGGDPTPDPTAVPAPTLEPTQFPSPAPTASVAVAADAYCADMCPEPRERKTGTP
jgi:hypothetical protein